MDSQQPVEKNIRTMSFLGLRDRVKHIHKTMPDRRFCFLLGAGASKSSGILTAGELAKEWLRTLHIEHLGLKENFVSWLSQKEGISESAAVALAGINESDTAALAAAYPTIYKAKWGDDVEEGYAEIEKHIEKAVPSYGYYALAEILATDDREHPSRHNVVITPNFDNLPAEALGALGKKLPIVIGHTVMTDFARPTLKRPLILKFHHDFLLNPVSDPQGVSKLTEGYEKALKKILGLFTPIVVGYGGNDGSLMELLRKLPDRYLHGGIYWCVLKGDQPGQVVEEVIKKQNGLLIEIPGFDELMSVLVEDFGLSVEPKKLVNRASERADELDKIKRELFDKTKGGLGSQTSSSESEEKSAVLDALEDGDTQRTSSQSVPWWHWQTQINQAEDPLKKDRLYQEAIHAMPESPELLGNYAIFLEDQNDLDGAEKLYQLAIAADPKDADYIGNYAEFLETKRKNIDEAEIFYQRAIEADTKHACNLGNYGLFLVDQRDDLERAEAFYKRAIEADSKHAISLGNYAELLILQGRMEEARRILVTAADIPWERMSGNPYRLAALLWMAGVTGTSAGEEGEEVVAALKGVLAVPGYVSTWNFEKVMAWVEKSFSEPGVRDFWLMLAKVCAGVEKVEVMDQFERWRNVEALPVDEGMLEVLRGRK